MTREDIPVAVKRAVGLHSDDSSICLVDRALYGQARRHEAGAAKCLLHGADSLPFGRRLPPDSLSHCATLARQVDPRRLLSVGQNDKTFRRQSAGCRRVCGNAFALRIHGRYGRRGQQDALQHRSRCRPSRSIHYCRDEPRGEKLANQEIALDAGPQLKLYLQELPVLPNEAAGNVADL